MAWHALFARGFTKALSASDRAHALLSDNLALMFLGHEEEAKALYLAHNVKPMSEQNSSLWERVIAKDFAEFRKAGLTHPVMADGELLKLGFKAGSLGSFAGSTPATPCRSAACLPESKTSSASSRGTRHDASVSTSRAG